ncbi:MAG TPA: hypothetical protein VFE33_02245 [Thermoanaerobaculia bacterium]|nr:hypothetical protein [Thermoanaerobaculia bacterium]
MTSEIEDGEQGQAGTQQGQHRHERLQGTSNRPRMPQISRLLRAEVRR